MFWNFYKFSAPLLQTLYLFTFSSLAFPFVWEISRKRKQEQKNRIFRRFCPKTSVFVANKTLIFSDLCLYRVIYTTPPRFWHSQGGSALIRNFLFFIFFIFCKILWFFKFRFSTEFWAFSRISYLLLILHKFSRYSFSLIFVRYGAFYVALRYSFIAIVFWTS